MNIQWVFVGIVWLAMIAHSSSVTLRLDFSIPSAVKMPVGEPLRVTCTATSFGDRDRAFNISNLKFKLEWDGNMSEKTSSRSIDESFVHVVNDTTIVLQYKELPSYLNYTRLCCYDRSNKSVKASRFMFVGVKPSKPSISSSVVENWDKLVFNWTGNSAAECKAWYKNRLEFDYHRCESTKSETFGCTVESPFNKSFEDQLSIKVNCSNDFGSDSSERTITLHHIVRPGAVSMKAFVTEANSSVIVVNFIVPKPRSISYSLIVVCKNTTYVNKTFVPIDWQLISSREIREYVSGLPKYTNCTVSMRARPSQSEGFYGPWTRYNLTTAEDVPLAAPRVCSSCFQVFQHQHSIFRDVVLYFESLSDEKARGKITHYRVGLDHRISIVRKIAASNRPFITLSGNETLNDTGIEVDKSYKLILDAATRMGYNETLVHQAIKIPRQSEILAEPRVNVVFINESMIFCWWRAVSGAHKYTLFWCVKSDSQVCKKSLNWVEFASDTNNHYIQLTSGSNDDYRIGFAVENHHGDGSGIVWSRCYSNYKSVVIRPPSVAEHSRAGCCNITISISKPDCRPDDGHIVGYEIYYEPSGHEDARENKTMTSIGHEVLVSLENLNPETEYVVSVRSISAQRTSSTSVTIQLEKTDSLGLSATIITLLVVGSLILAILLAGVIYSMYRNCFRKFCSWLSIGISPPLHASKDVRCNTVDASDVPCRTMLSLPLVLEEFKSPISVMRCNMVSSESGMPLLLTPEPVSNAHLHVAPELNANLPLEPTAEPESCVPLSWTPEPVNQEITQPCFSRLLPLIKSGSGEDWSSVDIPIHRDTSILPNPCFSQYDESAGSAALCSNSLLNVYTDGKCHYKSTFSQVPETDPSEVHMDCCFDPSVESMTFTSCSVVAAAAAAADDEKKVPSGATSHAKQRLLPFTFSSSEDHLENESSLMNCKGFDDNVDNVDDGDDRRGDICNEQHLLDMDLYSKGTKVTW